MTKTLNNPKKEAMRLWREMSSKIPVDLAAACYKLGITVSMEQLEDHISGMLVLNKDTAAIAVNRQHSNTRRRFTIAHELGHFFLHKKQSKLFIDAAPVFFRKSAMQGCSDIEIEANLFAAELLMPEEEVIKVVGGQTFDSFDEVAIQNLARKFEVSSQALVIRLNQLGFARAW